MRSFWKRLRQQFNPHSLSKGVKVFAMSVGARYVCWPRLRLLKLEPSRGTALEASAFNGVGSSLSPTGGPNLRGTGFSGKPWEGSPLGTVFGIKLFTDGVIVASLSDLYTSNGVVLPAAEAGILPRDYLLEADGMEFPATKAWRSILAKAPGRPSPSSAPGDQVFETQVTPCMEKVLLKPACGCGTAPRALAP